MCSRQGVVIRTLLCVVFAVKLIRMTFADNTLQGRVLNRPYIDMHGADTIIAVVCQGMEDEITSLGDVVAILPGVRRLVVADGNAVFLNTIGLMDEQAEAVDAVAAVDIRHAEFVFSGCTQYLGRVAGTP